MEFEKNLLFRKSREGEKVVIYDVITGKERKAPEGIWVLGGGIELPCKYYLYGPKLHKRFVRDALRH